MDSLYGGHQGVSFVLRGHYTSIQEMVTAFKGGANYTVIHYGEYVIIDTPNKNNIDNGKIYRRGYDYQNEMGGAEYIGQIVGPTSGTPYFQLNNIEDTKQEAAREVDNEQTYKRYPTGKDESGRYIISEDGDGQDIATFDFSKAERELVPGKTPEGDYNDTIKYTWVNIRDVTNAADSWFYVGFEWPYLVVDYTAHSVSAYDEMGDRADTPTSNRIDDNEHPFWEEWDIGVPKGIKGDTLRHLRVITPTQKDTIYDYKNITVEEDEQWGYISKLGDPGYDQLQDDIDNERQILVFDYVCFDKKAEGETVMVYVAPCNFVSGVQVDEDGTVTFTFTHDDPDIFSKKLQWIHDVQLDPTNGHFTVTNNRDEEIFSTDIDWIDDMYIDEESGEIAIHHILDENNSDEAKNGERAEVLEAKLKLIIKAHSTKDGKLSFETNTGEVIPVLGEDGQSFILRTIEDVKKDTDITDDKYIQIKYNDEEAYQNIGETINYIADMVVNPSNWHLLVLYADPQHRATADDLVFNNKDDYGNIWLNNITNSKGVNLGPDIYWQDFGPIKDQAGILIGFQVYPDELTEAGFEDAEILDYLNRTYPYGLTGEEQEIGGMSTKGKVVVFNPEGEDQKDFYAYDYKRGEWMGIGGFADSLLRQVEIYNSSIDSEAERQRAIDQLMTKGLLFTLKDSLVDTEPWPRYWAPEYTG